MELTVAFSFLAIIISILSYLFTKRSWYETYRPIVTARIETNDSGNVSAAFDIVVYNTGNRPAVNIRLRADKEVLEKAIEENGPEVLKKEIHACFSDEATIPLLQSGNSISNAFGMTGRNESTIKYGSRIPISIEYNDLNKRKYKTKQILIYRDTTFFAGTGWEKKGTS